MIGAVSEQIVSCLAWERSEDAEVISSSDAALAIKELVELNGGVCVLISLVALISNNGSAIQELGDVKLSSS